MNVLVLGSGVYVSGRGTSGHGTVLPALFPLYECGKVKKLLIAVTNVESGNLLKEKINQLNDFLGSKVIPQLIDLSTEKLSSVIQKNNIDLAYVCTPDNTHFELAKELLQNGVHVQVLKPLAPTAQECQKLASLQESKNLLGCVEYHKRFDRSNKLLRNLLLTGEVGSPLYFIVEYSQRKIVPTKHFKSWAHTTNPFQYLGVHYADVISWGLDHKAKLLRVSALGQKNYLKEKNLDVYDNVNVMAEYSYQGKTFTAHYLINWIDSENTSSMSDQRIKVIGTKGRVDCDQKDRGIFKVSDENAVETLNPDFCRAYLKRISRDKKTWNYEGYGIESVASFVGDVEKFKAKKITYQEWSEERATFRQSIEIAQLVEAANQSLREKGAWIQLGE